MNVRHFQVAVSLVYNGQLLPAPGFLQLLDATACLQEPRSEGVTA
jgi:hypothetical protein